MPGPVVVGSALSEETKKEGRRKEGKRGKRRGTGSGGGRKKAGQDGLRIPQHAPPQVKGSWTDESNSKAIAPSRNQPLFVFNPFEPPMVVLL